MAHFTAQHDLKITLVIYPAISCYISLAPYRNKLISTKCGQQSGPAQTYLHRYRFSSTLYESSQKGLHHHGGEIEADLIFFLHSIYLVILNIS